MKTIEQFHTVRKILGEPNARTYKKIYNHLNEQMIGFIQAAPLLMLSSIDEDGFPTISPKGDDPGFVRVQDANTLLIPERRGNRLAFTLQNILRHPKVGLQFIVPGTPEVLRVSGQCEIIEDEALCTEMASASHKALLIAKVTVTQSYFHCGKAFLRSHLWQPEQWGEPFKVSFGKEIGNNLGEGEAFVQEFDSYVAERYQTDL